MAGYDPKLDKELFTEELSFDGTKIKVSVMAYGEGAAKIQITRQNFNSSTNEFMFAKLGRMSKDEMTKILPIIDKAMKKM